MLLQILEDGYLTDSKGRRIDFTNTIVIMTSNIGAAKLQKEADLGFHASRTQELSDLDRVHEENSQKVVDELKKSMLPELLNRIDKVVVFRALTKKDIYRIIDIQIEELANRLRKHGIGIQLNPKGRQFLLDKGYDAHNGVRPLRRLIQDTIEDHISMSMLNGKYGKGDIIEVGTTKDELSYKTLTE